MTDYDDVLDYMRGKIDIVKKDILDEYLNESLDSCRSQFSSVIDLLGRDRKRKLKKWEPSIETYKALIRLAPTKGPSVAKYNSKLEELKNAISLQKKQYEDHPPLELKTEYNKKGITDAEYCYNYILNCKEKNLDFDTALVFGAYDNWKKLIDEASRGQLDVIAERAKKNKEYKHKILEVIHARKSPYQEAFYKAKNLTYDSSDASSDDASSIDDNEDIDPLVGRSLNKRLKLKPLKETMKGNTPEDNTPEDEISEDEISEDNTPEDEISEDEISEDNTPEDNTPEDEISEGNTSEDNGSLATQQQHILKVLPSLVAKEKPLYKVLGDLGQALPLINDLDVGEKIDNYLVDALWAFKDDNGDPIFRDKYEVMKTIEALKRGKNNKYNRPIKATDQIKREEAKIKTINPQIEKGIYRHQAENIYQY